MCLNNSYTETKIHDIENDPEKDLYRLLSDNNSDDHDTNPLVDNCVYCEPSQVKLLDCNRYKMKILHPNIHSLPNKIDELTN